MRNLQDETTLAVVGEIYRKLGVARYVTLAYGANRFYYVFGRNCPRGEFSVLEECNLTPGMVAEIADRIVGRSCVVMPWYTGTIDDLNLAWHAMYDVFDSEFGTPCFVGDWYEETSIYGLRVGRMCFGYRVALVVYLDESGIYAPGEPAAEQDGRVSDKEAMSALDGID